MRLNEMCSQGNSIQASHPTLSEQALAIKPFWAELNNDERNELLSLSLTALRQTASKSNATLPSELLAGLPVCSCFLLCSFVHIHIIQLAENMLTILHCIALRHRDCCWHHQTKANTDLHVLCMTHPNHGTHIFCHVFAPVITQAFS